MELAGHRAGIVVGILDPPVVVAGEGEIDLVRAGVQVERIPAFDVSRGQMGKLFDYLAVATDRERLIVDAVEIPQVEQRVGAVRPDEDGGARAEAVADPAVSEGFQPADVVQPHHGVRVAVLFVVAGLLAVGRLQEGEFRPGFAEVREVGAQVQPAGRQERRPQEGGDEGIPARVLRRIGFWLDLAHQGARMLAKGRPGRKRSFNDL